MNNIDLHIKVLQYIYNTKDDPETTAFNAMQMQKEDDDRMYFEYMKRKYCKQDINLIKDLETKLKKMGYNITESAAD